MTSETLASLAPALAAVLVVAMLCAAGLSAWRSWLSYKKLQLEAARPTGPMSDENDVQGETDTGVRIELAAVKERLRQLEAIASGVELQGPGFPERAGLLGAPSTADRPRELP